MMLDRSLLARMAGVLLAGCGIAFAPPAFAQALAPVREYDVVLDAIAIQGRPARLVFNLTNGDTAANALVRIGDFTTTGSQGHAYTIRGNVFGDLDTDFVLDDRAGMTTQYVQTDAVLGSRLSFRVKATDLHAAPDAPHDAVTFHVLDGHANTPLVATNDPTRANAVFVIELGQSDPAKRLTVYQRDLYQSIYTWSATVTPVPVPEPAAMAAACAAIAALALLRRKGTR